MKNSDLVYPNKKESINIEEPDSDLSRTISNTTDINDFYTKD